MLWLFSAGHARRMLITGNNRMHWAVGRFVSPSLPQRMAPSALGDTPTTAGRGRRGQAETRGSLAVSDPDHGRAVALP